MLSSFSLSFYKWLRANALDSEKFGIEDFAIYHIQITALIWQCLEGFDNNCDLIGFRQSYKPSNFAALQFS